MRSLFAAALRDDYYNSHHIPRRLVEEARRAAQSSRTRDACWRDIGDPISHNVQLVIPAKAGIQKARLKTSWIPAFAGMTDEMESKFDPFGDD
ncbi:MAG: hypothetical protein IPI44_22330 [Sulfuritalea sp.]|nr:hypothetical protein [Sulfuritalea sp.]